MKSILLLICVMAMAATASGEIYKWTDSRGEEHFTDNPDKIPAKYRNKAREMDVKPVIQETEQPSQTELKSDEPAAQKLFGGHDEKWWRSRYKALRAEIKGIQDNLPDKKAELSVLRHSWVISMGRTPKAGESTTVGTLTNKSALSTPGQHREAYYKKKTEIEGDEARINELQNKITELDGEAARAGVPLEWRQ